LNEDKNERQRLEEAIEPEQNRLQLSIT